VIDSAAVFASPTARAGAVFTVAVAVVLMVGAFDAAASAPPPSTTVPLPPSGIFTLPGGGLEVRFTAAPVVINDPDGVSKSYLIGVEEDTETLSVLTPTAFGAAAGATPAERVLLFLDASGDEIEVLANTQTRLGPFPAAYFIARITLADGRRAVLYGAAVVRPNDVSYVFYTDVGGDDGDRGRSFVESYAVMIDPLPALPAPTTTVPAAPTTTSPAVTTSTLAVTTTSAPATSTSAASTTSPATTTTVPAGATVSFDGRWLVRFPDGADVSLRASSEDGFAYAEYLSVVGDDALSVRVTELPTAFAWSPAGAAALDAERGGGTVLQSTLTSVDGAPGARFTLADADSDTSGDTTEVLLVRAGGQLYRIAYADGGESSADAAAEFIDSFHLR
jgi:hypothetical protein